MLASKIHTSVRSPMESLCSMPGELRGETGEEAKDSSSWYQGRRSVTWGGLGWIMFA